MAKVPSQKRAHHRKLAVIALECCVPLLLLIYVPGFCISYFGAKDPDILSHHAWLAGYNNAELYVRDTLQLYGRGAELDPRIVFLAIDAESSNLDELSPAEVQQSEALQLMSRGFPWNRRVYGMILERLVDAGAKVVAFDLRCPSEKPEDPEVRPTFERYERALVIGSNLQWVDNGEGGYKPSLELPSPLLIDPQRAESCTGFVNFKPEWDRRVRRAIYRTTIDGFFENLNRDVEAHPLLSLSAQAAQKAGFGNAIPSLGEERLIRFVENPQPHSVHDIFVPNIWSANYKNGAVFKDKIVFVGPFGNWVKESNDVLPTPFGQMLGPQIHLSALNALLRNDFLTMSPSWVDGLLVLAGAFVSWVIGILVGAPRIRLLAFAAAVILYVGLAFLLYNSGGLLAPLMSPSLALVSSGVVGLIWERVIEGKEKERVRKTLERYVSKDVVKEVLDNPQSYLHTAGGERRPLTILFSDLRGFTTITESADPAKLVEQLNEYFTEMVRIVFAHRGTLDKFIGDAVMAHWGGIMSRGKGPDACRAVAAALDMLKALDRLNADWKARGMIELRIGVGVNHGDAICANIGSEEKREFTAIGDPVNFASRLEGATKEFKQDLLIGEGVAPLVQGDYLLRSVDFLQVKGKTKPVEIFSVVAARNGGAPAWLSPYEEGIRLFRQRAFAEAAAKFAAAAELVPGDYLTREYLRRSREYVESPPPADWNGVFVMTKK